MPDEPWITMEVLNVVFDLLMMEYPLTNHDNIVQHKQLLHAKYQCVITNLDEILDRISSIASGEWEWPTK